MPTQHSYRTAITVLTSHFSLLTFLAASVCAPLLAAPAVAQDNSLPSSLRGLGIDQKLNAQIPLDLTFRDDTGRPVRLGDLFDGRKPVLLTLVYYNCPMLCTLVLNDTLRSLRPLPLTIGKDFDVLTISFDPREGPELAAAKKRHYLEAYGRPGAERGWHFLTGDEEAIRRLTDAVGFRYRYDAGLDQFFHPSGITILTPDGRISRYFFGVSYVPKDVRLALVEASDGRIGSVTDAVLLYCFQYDPATGKYSLAIMNALRAGGVLTLVALGMMMVRMHRVERRRKELPLDEHEDPSVGEDQESSSP